MGLRCRGLGFKWIILTLYMMSLTLALSECVQNLLTHANRIELVFVT